MSRTEGAGPKRRRKSMSPGVGVSWERGLPGRRLVSLLCRSATSQDGSQRPKRAGRAGWGNSGSTRGIGAGGLWRRSAARRGGSTSGGPAVCACRAIPTASTRWRRRSAGTGRRTGDTAEAIAALSHHHGQATRLPVRDRPRSSRCATAPPGVTGAALSATARACAAGPPRSRRLRQPAARERRRPYQNRLHFPLPCGFPFRNAPS